MIVLGKEGLTERSGDVVMSVIQETVEQDKDGATIKTLQGLSGRQLVIGNHWNNPTGKFRLGNEFDKSQGVKNAHELFPKPCLDRLLAKRKKDFDIKHNAILSAIQPDVSEESESQCKLDVLKDLLKSYQGTNDLIFKDPGIICDCVVFHDGSKWRAGNIKNNTYNSH